jgi:hypothetical protein
MQSVHIITNVVIWNPAQAREHLNIWVYPMKIIPERRYAHYLMSTFLLREISIGVRAKAFNAGDIGRGLTQHVIQILTCNVHYIIYFDHAFENTCILWIFIFLEIFLRHVIQILTCNIQYIIVLSRIIVLNIWIFECTRWRLFQIFLEIFLNF